MASLLDLVLPDAIAVARPTLHHLLIEEKKPRKPLVAAVIFRATSEQKIQMAADRLDDDVQELARLVDAQLPPLVLEPLP